MEATISAMGLHGQLLHLNNRLLHMKKFAALISSIFFGITFATGCTSTPVAVTIKDSGDQQIKVKGL